MKLREAKNLIIKAASKELGFNLSNKTDVEQYLIVGVKLGNITPEQAAATTNENYSNVCKKLFNEAQA